MTTSLPPRVIQFTTNYKLSLFENHMICVKLQTNFSGSDSSQVCNSPCSLQTVSTVSASSVPAVVHHHHLKPYSVVVNVSKFEIRDQSPAQSGTLTYRAPVVECYLLKHFFSVSAFIRVCKENSNENNANFLLFLYEIKKTFESFSLIFSERTYLFYGFCNEFIDAIQLSSFNSEGE